MNKDINIVADNQFWMTGYFSTSEKPLNTFLKSITTTKGAWVFKVLSDKDKEIMRNYYYPEVLHFNAECNKCICMHINKKISINSVEIFIDKIQVSLLPFNILIYSISMNCTQVVIKDMLKVFTQIRQISRYGALESIQPFVDIAIEPIRQLYALVTGKMCTKNQQLVENGNKLKLYQSVILDRTVLQTENTDHLLYCLGTLGLNDPTSHNGTPLSYMTDLITKYKIAVYNHWSALSLLDTMTYLSDREVEHYTRDLWHTDYFELIYLYQLYRKIFLYRTNSEFRLKTRPVHHIHNELEYFDNHYTYHFVSYNFLPNLINNMVESSLEIAEEMKQMNNIVKCTVLGEREKRDKRTNSVLTWLTIITSLSAIFDLVVGIWGNKLSMLKDLWWIFLIVGVIIAIIIIVTILLIHKRQKIKV